MKLGKGQGLGSVELVGCARGLEFILSTRRVLAGELYDSIYCETFCFHGSFLSESHSPKCPDSLFCGA